MTREEPKFLTVIRDFTTLFHAILRRKSSEWLEWSIENDLGMRFTIWSLDLAIRDFGSSKHVSTVRTGYEKNVTNLFSCFGKTNFYIRGPLFFRS